MVAFAKLAALAAMVLGRAAAVPGRIFGVRDFDICFDRFYDGDCKVGVGSTNKLDNNNCKTFNDSPFRGFRYVKKNNHQNGNNCVVLVYENDDCSGAGFLLGPATETYGQCGNFPLGARSASVTCDGKKPS